MSIGMANGGKTPQEKIKAIYPHIVVGGDIDKPCYNIHWYDIEQKTMICGFSSYKLELVRKWLEEEFEVVERDIDGLLNRQQEQLNNYSHNVRNMSKDFLVQQKIIQEQQAEIERLKKGWKADVVETENIKTEAIKEFADKLKKQFKEDINDIEDSITRITDPDAIDGQYETIATFELSIDYIDNVVAEMVGEGK